ncbi:plant intracellular ras group-related LRR 3 [Striga asiatica]|uniref:Plant intracellular ras group-related LRR 3 n=1 Tax=Striga asiatica TaxID=4170 RepID=A0A5A7R920_STRAF|nr:plant intracellular ras group-related LRR 3 [Striga asiatica]
MPSVNHSLQNGVTKENPQLLLEGDKIPTLHVAIQSISGPSHPISVGPNPHATLQAATQTTAHLNIIARSLGLPVISQIPPQPTYQSSPQETLTSQPISAPQPEIQPLLPDNTQAQQPATTHLPPQPVTRRYISTCRRRTAVADEKPPERVQTIVRRQPNYHSPPTISFAQSVAHRYPIHTQIAPPSLRLPRSSPTFPPALRPEPPSITHNHRPHPVLTEDASTPPRRNRDGLSPATMIRRFRRSMWRIASNSLWIEAATMTEKVTMWQRAAVARGSVDIG